MLAVALPPSNNERSAFIREQAQEDYQHHQDVLAHQNSGLRPRIKGGVNTDGSFGVTFDNNDKNYRDRGYGYEKAYAYSRETAVIDFDADKPVLDARDIVEKYGNSGEKNEEDLLSSISHKVSS